MLLHASPIGPGERVTCADCGRVMHEDDDDAVWDGDTIRCARCIKERKEDEDAADREFDAYEREVRANFYRDHG